MSTFSAWGLVYMCLIALWNRFSLLCTQNETRPHKLCFHYNYIQLQHKNRKTSELRYKSSCSPHRQVCIKAPMFPLQRLNQILEDKLIIGVFDQRNWDSELVLLPDQQIIFTQTDQKHQLLLNYCDISDSKRYFFIRGSLLFCCFLVFSWGI